MSDQQRFKQELDFRLCTPEKISEVLSDAQNRGEPIDPVELAAAKIDSGGRSILTEQPARNYELTLPRWEPATTRFNTVAHDKAKMTNMELINNSSLDKMPNM